MSWGEALGLDDFKGEDFDPDSFIMGLLEPQMDRWAGAGGKKKRFDPKEMLEILRARQEEVAELKAEAEAASREARDMASQLGKEHRQCVARVRGEAEKALSEVRSLEEKVASVGSKAVSIGQRIDKVDRQRRRAKEAERAIHVFDDMRSEDEGTRSAAMASLVPSSSSAEVGQETSPRGRRTATNPKPEHSLMESASMLRKIDGMTRVLHVEGSARAIDSLAVVNERFELALLAEFDAAKERWDVERSEESLDGMKLCTASLFSFNGGGSCIQRYVSGLPFCADASLMMRDDEGIDASTTLEAATGEISRVLDAVSTMFDEQRQQIALIFPQSGRVMGAVVQRALNQRVQRVVDACLATLEGAQGQGEWMDCVEMAYARVHGLLLALAEGGVDMGDTDPGKLLQDVMGEHRERFVQHSFFTLTSLLAEVLPAAAPPSLPINTSAGGFLNRGVAAAAAMAGVEKPPLSPRGRMNMLEQASGITEKCARGVLVTTRDIPKSPSDGCFEVLRCFDHMITAVSNHLKAHMAAAKTGCVKGSERSVVAVPSEIKVAVHAVVIVQQFAEERVAPVTRHDVKQAAESSTKVWDFSFSVESSVSDLLSALVSYVGKTLTSKLSSLQKRSDFLSKEDECSLEPTLACTEGIAFIHSVKQAWLEHGPPSLYSSKESKEALDTNTRSFLAEIARTSCRVVTSHIRNYQYSPVGGLQVMRDLHMWKQASTSLHSADTERRFEEYKEASNVLIIPQNDLQGFLENGGFYKQSACADLLELRSDWKAVKDSMQLGDKAVIKPTRATGASFAAGSLTSPTKNVTRK